MLALYDDSAILMPTFSPHAFKDKAELRVYFEQLGTREALNVKLHENTVVCQRIEEQRYVISGIYSFAFKLDETELTFPSRFTFVVDLDRPSPILHHHSSQMPSDRF